MNYKNLDYVIYGTVNETEKILMQLNCLKIAVKAIVVNDEVRSYKGNNDISRFSKNQIIKFAADKIPVLFYRLIILVYFVLKSVNCVGKLGLAL